MNNLEDDVARVRAVTEAVAGPQKVWLLISAYIESAGAYASATAYATRYAAIESFEESMERDIYDDSEIKAKTAQLATDGTVKLGETTYVLEESRVWE